MKMVFVSQPLSTGGAERVVAALSNRFFELGNEIKIIIVDNGDNNTYYTHEEIEFIHIDKPVNPILDLFHRTIEIRRYLNDYKPDVVLPFTTQKNISVLLATLFTKHKVIISERNNPYQDPKSIFLRILRKLLYFTADGFVFQTEGAKEYFSKKIQDRSCVIPNPINNKLPNVWDGVREPRIVMVNRLDSQKNIPMAINAFKSIVEIYPNYNLDIYGKGPIKKELIQLISDNSLNDKVHLKGFCTDVIDQIKSAEIFLMTSDYEGMSNSLMEAMALGLVCVSTDHPTGGAKALIRNDYNGILYPVRDTQSCIKALEKVLSSKEKREELSKNAVKIRTELTIDNIAEQWIRYIETIIRI